MRKSILTVILLALCPLLAAQQALDNNAIIKLVKAGLSDDLILTTINASAGTYDTSANGLIALKKGGVSDKVVSAIILKASGSAPAAGGAPAASSGTTIGGAPAGAGSAGAAAGWGVAGATTATSQTGIPPGVDDIGVYYQDPGGAWQEVPVEVVNFKTGGAVKHIASVGIVKGDLNGLIGGGKSRLALKMPASFIIYVPEGRSPGEYQLLRLRAKNDSREFRSSTGGVVHESGGAIRDTVDYTTKKLAPRVYEVTLGGEVGKGEYGFLPPLDAVSEKSMASSGKMYTFSLGQ